MKPFIFCFFCLFIGCAAIEKGTHEQVDFASDPTGADVYIDGELLGTTPVTLKLESKHTYRIEFKKKGFAPKQYTITNHIGTKWVVFDVILGLAPVLVDAFTGSWYELDQDYVKAYLDKE
jgi:hypothetical protein